MKKKSILTLVLSLVLVGAISVGATMAYMTSKTNEVTNTFTFGNVKIGLSETNWDKADGGKEIAKNMYPGVTAPKNPVVTNTGVNDCWVRIKVTGIDKLEALGFKVIGLPTDNATWTFTADKDATKDGTYTYNTKLAKDAKTLELFTSVSLPAETKIVDGKLVVGETSTEFNSTAANISKDIVIKAEAVQADGLGASPTGAFETAKADF